MEPQLYKVVHIRGKKSIVKCYRCQWQADFQPNLSLQDYCQMHKHNCPTEKQIAMNYQKVFPNPLSQKESKSGKSNQQSQSMESLESSSIDMPERKKKSKSKGKHHQKQFSQQSSGKQKEDEKRKRIQTLQKNKRGRQDTYDKKKNKKQEKVIKSNNQEIEDNPKNLNKRALPSLTKDDKKKMNEKSVVIISSDLQAKRFRRNEVPENVISVDSQSQELHQPQSPQIQQNVKQEGQVKLEEKPLNSLDIFIEVQEQYIQFPRQLPVIQNLSQLQLFVQRFNSLRNQIKFNAEAASQKIVGYRKTIEFLNTQIQSQNKRVIQYHQMKRQLAKRAFQISENQFFGELQTNKLVQSIKTSGNKKWNSFFQSKKQWQKLNLLLKQKEVSEEQKQYAQQAYEMNTKRKTFKLIFEMDDDQFDGAKQGKKQ